MICLELFETTAANGASAILRYIKQGFLLLGS
jgi:hypothetical protein